MNWLQNLLVGILFFGALTMVGYFTIVSESGPFASRGRQMVVFFDNAEGVKAGSRVTVLGVPAGLVDNIELVPVDAEGRVVPVDSPDRVGQRVAITLELKQQVVFYENYNIEIKNESLLSGKVISINPGSSRPRDGAAGAREIEVLMPAVSELAEKNQTALAYLLDRGGENAPRLQGSAAGDPVAGLAELITENRTNVRQTIENVREITRKINEGQGTLGQLVNNDELHRNANTLVTDAQTVVNELRESLEDTREQAPVTSFVRAALTAF
ncbi:MAG: MCE family protein [Spirochaetales bacterium]|nr:MCE family protein [Leptospiraceae bacterium]MCP5480070.1 MCE family protein [Spirochaetales bacterium]MCP5485589.1 MCE family protein [Spirochaetales bacterium]